MTSIITNFNSLNPNAPPNSSPIKLTQGQSIYINITAIKGEQIQFNLGGQSFTANSKVPLSEIGQIKVTVLQTSPSLQLGISTEKAFSHQSPQLIQDTLRQLLPSQLPVSQALQQITQTGLMQLFPPAIQAQLSSLLEHYFKPSANTTAKEIKLHLQNSGLFFESAIKKNQTLSPHDLKGKLLYLNQQINNLAQNQAATNKLSAILGQAINKITLQQVQILENPELLSLQLSLSQENYIKKIQIDFRKSYNIKETLTEILLTINLAEGESIYKLILNNDKISIYIWASNTQLNNKIAEKTAILRLQLIESGLPIKDLFIAKIKPQVSPHTKQIALIDIHV